MNEVLCIYENGYSQRASTNLSGAHDIHNGSDLNLSGNARAVLRSFAHESYEYSYASFGSVWTGFGNDKGETKKTKEKQRRNKREVFTYSSVIIMRRTNKIKKGNC